MERRTFFWTMAGGLLAAPLAARAQQLTKEWRIGYLSPTVPDSIETTWLREFRKALTTLGYTEDATLVERHAENKLDRLPALAAELVSLRVDVIMTFATPASLAAKATTTTIPIVMVAVGDPVGVGLVKSLSRPGANITGLSLNNVESAEKRVELLKEAVPKLTRVAVLANKGNPAFNALQLARTRKVAERRGIAVTVFEVTKPEDFEDAFAAMAKDRVNGVVILPDAAWTAQRKRIVQLALQYRLPSVISDSRTADADFLLAYGPDVAEIYRKAANYVDRILKGTKPADLPVEQPTKFELMINLKTAKALGLTIPPALLQRADQVIE
jgi:putative ABC transport system substrate-binding protein